MFYCNRWVNAIIQAAGKNAAETLSCLREIAPLLKPLYLSGRNAAEKLEKLLRGQLNIKPGETPGLEYAIRIICLLVEKSNFKHIDIVLERIEERLNDQMGILNVTVESATPLEDSTERELKQKIMKHTGAAEINIRNRIVPELLGGYRLKIGWYYIDASLRRQLELMKNELIAAAISVRDGGNNGEL